jgi:hypothetical protein
VRWHHGYAHDTSWSPHSTSSSEGLKTQLKEALSKTDAAQPWAGLTLNICASRTPHIPGNTYPSPQSTGTLHPAYSILSGLVPSTLMYASTLTILPNP